MKLDTCCDELERLRNEGLVDGYSGEQLTQIIILRSCVWPSNNMYLDDLHVSSQVGEAD